jgi:hypothetical protein
MYFVGILPVATHTEKFSSPPWSFLPLHAYSARAICISLFFLPSLSEASRSEIDPDIDALIGTVRKIETKAPAYRYTQQFNPAGHLINAVLQLNDGEVMQHAFRRDESGYLLEEIVTNATGSPLFHRQVTYGFDQAGYRTAAIATNQQGNFLEGHFYIYNAHGILSDPRKSSFPIWVLG